MPEDTLDKAAHQTLSKVWHDLIAKGIEHRKDFRDGYEISRKFAYGDHDFVYEDAAPESAFKATVPKVWEMVNIFGPMLNFRNPHRNVRVRFARGQEDPRVPFVQLLKMLLNYSVNELGLVRNMRPCVEESILGCGVMWLERDRTSDLFGHFHDTPLNLIIDPDATRIEDAWWIARRKLMPRWEVADLFGVALDHEDLPSTGRDSVGEAMVAETDHRDRERSGKTHDLLAVYEVWSRMGIGWRARGVREENLRNAREEKDEEMFRHFYVLMTSNRIWKHGEWPVPLWADNEWPCELLYYRKKSDYVWPVPLLQPSLGMQKAIDWVMMFIWQHLRVTSRDFIVGPNSLEETVREKILTGLDMEFIGVNSSDLEEGKRLEDIVGFLKHPPMQGDLWRFMDLALRMWEDSSGLYPALYSQSGGAEPRTATADQNRQQRADLRPDDMREVVEQMHSRMARKEALACILNYDQAFISEIFGKEWAEHWPRYEPGMLNRVMREHDYRIEAGSSAKPNIQTERDNSMEAFDRLAQVAMQVGDIGALNKLAYQLQRSLTVQEEDIVTFQPPPPPEEKPDPSAEAKVATEEAKGELVRTKIDTERLKQALEGAKAGQEAATQAAQAGGGGAGPGEVVEIVNGVPVRA